MDPTSVGTAVNIGLTQIAKVINALKDYGPAAYYGDKSLPEVAKLCRVEPITVVSKDLLNNPETKLVLNSLCSMFAGYWLQAVDILQKVGHVEVVRLLDRLNPDRDSTGFLMAAGMESYDKISLESCKYKLPTHSKTALENEGGTNRRDVIEAMARLADDERRMQRERERLDKEKHKIEIGKIDEKLRELARRRQVIEGGSAQDIDLDTLANLSIGRMINVSIPFTRKAIDGSSESHEVTIPIAFRLLVSSIPNESITRVMTYHSQDLSLGERIHSARSGSIGFIRDLIMAQDLIDEYKKAAITDPSNILSEITRRNMNAKKFGLLTKNPSLVAASSLFVISDAAKREIEIKLGGKLDNSRIREKAFENTYSMIVAVVSSEWQNVTFYIRGIARGATFSFRELEGKTKGAGPDIGDILKAISSGQPPSF